MDELLPLHLGDEGYGVDGVKGQSRATSTVSPLLSLQFVDLFCYFMILCRPPPRDLPEWVIYIFVFRLRHILGVEERDKKAH
jgi:hypothetical protein